VTFTFGAALPTTPGTIFWAVIENIRESHTRQEEVIFSIGGTNFAVVDKKNRYVASDRMENPCKRCPLTNNKFLIRIVDNGAAPAVKVLRGLNCLRADYFAINAPPTP
jgi:hypothetical protein